MIWNDYYYDNITSSYRYGIAGQLLSDTADRLWGDNGVMLQPYSELPCTGYSLPQSHITPEGDVLVVYAKDSLTVINEADTIYSTFLKATRVNPSGNFVWNDEQVFLSDEASWKLSMFSSAYVNNQVVTIWTDNRSGTDLTWPGDLYAQNVRGDGSLGPAISIDEPEQVNTPYSLYPNPVKQTMHIRYSVLQPGKTEFILYNLKGQRVAYDAVENGFEGVYEKIFTTQKLQTGIYFIKIENGTHKEVKKVVILK